MEHRLELFQEQSRFADVQNEEVYFGLCYDWPCLLDYFFLNNANISVCFKIGTNFALAVCDSYVIKL